jgi:hypothetical protein
MNPQAMAELCTTALSQGQRTVTFTHPKGVRLPHGFPRGEILSESKAGVNTTYKPGHILSWLRTGALIAPLEESGKPKPDRTRKCN